MVGLIHVNVEDEIPGRDLVLGGRVNIATDEIPERSELDQQRHAQIVFAVTMDWRVLGSNHPNAGGWTVSAAAIQPCGASDLD